MRIISKWKDYYDYLQGIYGVDETLILDRTEFHLTSLTIPKDYKVEVFYICGWEIQGIWLNGELLFGKEIEPYALSEKEVHKGRYRTRRYYYSGRWDDGIKRYHIDVPKEDGYFSYRQLTKEPRKLISPTINDKYNCPILLGTTDKNGKPIDRKGFNDVKKHPILKDYGIQKVFSPEEMWLMLSAWLGAQKDVVIPNNQSDKEKIVSAGFDLKTSFRKM
jgi:hypothetical protein